MGARSSGPVPSVKCAGAWPVNTLTPAGSSVETFRKEVRDLAEDRIDPDAKRGREEAGPLNVEPRREPAGHRSDHRRVAGSAEALPSLSKLKKASFEAPKLPKELTWNSSLRF